MRFEAEAESLLFKAGRSFSFGLTLAFFLVMAYLLVFRGELVKSNLLLLALAILALVLANVVFPRALKMVRKNDLSKGMLDGSKLFAEKFSLAITWVALSATYFVGVGFVFALSRLFRKRFVAIRPCKKKSYWIEKKEMGKDSEMF